MPLAIMRPVIEAPWAAIVWCLLFSEFLRLFLKCQLLTILNDPSTVDQVVEELLEVRQMNRAS
jgi:hypothetical protein